MYQLFDYFLLADDKKDKTSTAAAAKSDAALSFPTTPTKASKTNAVPAAATATPVTPTSAAAQSAPTNPLGVNLEKVDLGKISSILSSLTSAMKNTGVFKGWEDGCYNDRNLQKHTSIL